MTEPIYPLEPEENPFVRFVCGTCRDARHVSGPEGVSTIPCPVCGTDDGRRAVFARSSLMPELHVLDLTDEETVVYREWKARGFHELDCLRWIEGQRYDPRKDPTFLAECESALAEWRASRDEAYDAYRFSHPYSAGDGRIGREKDRFGRIFETKEGHLTGPPTQDETEPVRSPVRALRPAETRGASAKAVLMPIQTPETPRQGPNAAQDVPLPVLPPVVRNGQPARETAAKTPQKTEVSDLKNPPSDGYSGAETGGSLAPSNTSGDKKTEQSELPGATGFGDVLDQLDRGDEDGPPW